METLPELVEDEKFGPGAVITVPVQAPTRAKIRTEKVEEFLNRVKYFTNNWVKPGHQYGMNTHNVSATVSIQEKDWNEVREWLWDNQDSFNGLSFLPYDTGTYVQAPFEDITKTEFNKLLKTLTEVNLENVIEETDNTDLAGELACAGGSCEVTSLN